MVEIVMLLGVSKSGKDTVGKEYVKNGFTRIAFADIPKIELAEKLNIPLEYLTEQGPMKVKYRDSLIEYAEEKRKENKFYWINKAFEPYLNINTYLTSGKYVITDMRRLSEVDWYEQIKEQHKNINIKIYLVEKPGVKENDILTLQTIAKVIREGYLTDIILNDSTIEELNNKILNLIK